MNSLLTILLAASTTASILPLKFNFGGEHTPSLKSVKQCEGHESDPLVLLEGSTPDIICMPGETLLNMVTQMSEDMPMDLIINMDLHKLTPFPMTVPCLNGVGSCEYEVCPMITDLADTICPSFPPEQPCGCPLLAGEITFVDVSMPVQDMGPILGEVMKGEYRATAMLYSAAAKDRTLGCIEFEFALDTC